VSSFVDLRPIPVTSIQSCTNYVRPGVFEDATRRHRAKPKTLFSPTTLPFSPECGGPA